LLSALVCVVSVEMSPTEYAHPESLVSTEWVVEHLSDPQVRIIESNEDVLLYDTGHIPGAVHIDWRRDLNDQTVRDYIDPKGFAELASRIGITPETTVVFYGDKSNWWACYALWVFSLFGHKDLRIANGGRDKWIAEKRELTREVPTYAPTQYPVPPGRADDKIRAFTKRHWRKARQASHLSTYVPLVGERSSHTWFVLTKLLGFEDVKNYDGSWTEWGNKVRAPIQKP